MSETFQQRVARLKAEREAKQATAAPSLIVVKPVVVPDEEAKFDADLIPDIEPEYERTETDLEIDRIIEGIDILGAYAKWCGKMTPKVGKKRESIMVSCPKPEHRDSNPSAWLNLDKDTWFCGSCQEGGDKFDIAAFHYGMPVPGYKDGKNFPELRRRIAEDLGYVVKRTLGGTEYVEKVIEEADEPTHDAPVEADATTVSESPAGDDHGSVTTAPSVLSETYEATSPAEPVASVSSLFGDDDDDGPDEILDYPAIDWYSITPPDSFLRAWMESTSKDDLPEEFYFWLGMQALGMAAGRDTVMPDAKAVNANLFVCLFGPSGQGKSRAQYGLTDLLYEALPYDHDDPISTGSYIVPSPGSAEALVDSFSKPIYDPSDPKKLMGYSRIRGLVRFDELSTLAGRGSRVGSVMKPTLMQFFDGDRRIELKTRGVGHVICEMPYASCVTSTQPRAIKDILTATDADSGFLNRWIFATGRPKKTIWVGRKPLDLTEPIRLLREARSWCSSVPSIPMGDEAERIYAEWGENVFSRARDRDQHSLLTRCDLHIKKIMLLFAIDRHERVISAQTAMDAISLWGYLEKSYDLLRGNIGMGPLEEYRKVIRGAIERFEHRHKKPVSQRELLKLIKRHNIPLEDYNKTITNMIRVGEITDKVLKSRNGNTLTAFSIASGE